VEDIYYDEGERTVCVSPIGVRCLEDALRKAGLVPLIQDKKNMNDKIDETVAKAKPDLHIVGTVYRVEEPTYDYGDVKDEWINSILTVPLLQFEGKWVEIIVKVIE